MQITDHWTDYVPAIIKFPVAGIIGILGALLIPTMVVDKVPWLHALRYRIGEIFSD